MSDFSIESYMCGLVTGSLNEDVTRNEIAAEFRHMIGLLQIIRCLQSNKDCAKHLSEVIELLEKWYKFWFVTRPLLLGVQPIK